MVIKSARERHKNGWENGGENGAKMAGESSRTMVKRAEWLQNEYDDLDGE